MSNYKGNKKDGLGRIGPALVLLVILVIAAYAVYKLFFIPGPVVKGMDEFNFLPVSKTVKLSSANIKSIEISIYKDGKKVDLLRDAPGTAEKMYALEIKPKYLGLNDGKAVITIRAKAGIFKKVQYDIESIIDTVPPTLDVTKTTSVVDRGSAGFAVLRSAGADSVYIKLVDKTKSTEYKAFTAYKIPDEPGSQTESSYYVFFPAPYNIGSQSVYYAVARDKAGNENITALQTEIKIKTYTKSSINIDDSFINKVISSLLNEVNIDDPESAFRKVNEEWRRQSLIRLIDLAQKPEPRILWNGRLLQMKNSKVMASYGDERTYIYKGKTISNSVHLGYDLASTQNAPVEAANTGIVRLAGDLSIYGNTVIIDHGLGLMSLYGHLSVIMVKEGQKVEKGEIIARTGATGLAGGDHLHFGVLIHGYEVSPLYWLDQYWIQVNILDLMTG